MKTEILQKAELKMIIPLKTERLIIRGFLPEDGEELFEYLSDPEVVSFKCDDKGQPIWVNTSLYGLLREDYER